MTDDIVIRILREIQSGQSDLKRNIDDLRSDVVMQLAALNEKLSGQLLSEIELRKELNDLRNRLHRIEKRLELTD